MSDLLDKIRQIAADVFAEPVANISAESTPDTIEAWDSLTHLNFVLALEETFAFEVDPDESEAAGKSIGDAVRMVAKKQGD